MALLQSKKQPKGQGEPKAKIKKVRGIEDWPYLILCGLSAAYFFLFMNQGNSDVEFFLILTIMLFSGLYGFYTRLSYTTWELWVYDEELVEKMILGLEKHYPFFQLQRFRVKPSVKGMSLFKGQGVELEYDLLLQFTGGRLLLPLEAQGTIALIQQLLQYYQKKKPEIADTMERELSYYGIDLR